MNQHLLNFNKLHNKPSPTKLLQRFNNKNPVLDTNASCVSVQEGVERGYSIVIVQCQDRRKLLFDVVCTLTDMNYVISHGTLDTSRDQAHEEFYIKHMDGSPISSKVERQRVIRCVQAAIERRGFEGLRLEL